MNKDMRRVVREARRQDFEVKKSNGGHLRFRAPSGALIFDSATHIDPRAFRNFLSRMKRAGFVDGKTSPRGDEDPILEIE